MSLSPRLKKLQDKFKGQPAPANPWRFLRQEIQLDSDYDKCHCKRVLIRQVKLPLGDIAHRVVVLAGVPASRFQFRVDGGRHFDEEDQSVNRSATPMVSGEGILQLPNVIAPPHQYLAFFLNTALPFKIPGNHVDDIFTASDWYGSRKMLCSFESHLPFSSSCILPNGVSSLE